MQDGLASRVPEMQGTKRATLQQLLRAEDKEQLAWDILWRFALPMHDQALLSEQRVEGMAALIQADLEDMAQVDISGYKATALDALWDARRVRMAGREQGLAYGVDLSAYPDESSVREVVMAMLWDLMGDSFPMWPEEL